jgi:hypothetical protein
MAENLYRIESRVESGEAIAIMAAGVRNPVATGLRSSRMGTKRGRKPFCLRVQRLSKLDRAWHGRCTWVLDLSLDCHFCPVSGAGKEGLKWPND